LNYISNIFQKTKVFLVDEFFKRFNNRLHKGCILILKDKIKGGGRMAIILKREGDWKDA
jgi:hypothetical protein